MKFTEICDFDEKTGRSREGAWIEIRHGTNYYKLNYVAPARERGLKFNSLWGYGYCLVVAPARERGLK